MKDSQELKNIGFKDVEKFVPIKVGDNKIIMYYNEKYFLMIDEKCIELKGVTTMKDVKIFMLLIQGV